MADLVLKDPRVRTPDLEMILLLKDTNGIVCNCTVTVDRAVLACFSTEELATRYLLPALDNILSSAELAGFLGPRVGSC